MDMHIREAGAEAPLALAEQIDAARMLEHGITKERLPFVYGWHRMSVSAPTEEIVRPAGRGGHRALPRHGHRRRQLHRRPVLAVLRGAAGREGPGQRLRAAAAAAHHRGRHGDRHGRPRGSFRRGGVAGDRTSARTLGRARSIVHFDPLVAATKQPADGHRDHRRARRRQDHAGAAADLPDGAARGHRRGRSTRRATPSRWCSCCRRRGRKARTHPARLGRARAARPVLVRRRPRREEDDGHRDAAAAAAAHVGGARVGR